MSAWSRFVSRWLFVWFALASPPAICQEQETVTIKDALRDDDKNFVPDRLGQTVTLTGVLTSDPIVLSSTASLTPMQDDTGGIVLFTRDASLLAGHFKRGDSVQVRGKISQYKGQEELRIESIRSLGARAVPPPRDIVAADVLGELHESQLVRLAGDLVVPPDFSQKNSSPLLRDRSGEVPIYIPPRFFNNPKFSERLMKGGGIEVVGIVGQVIENPPFNAGYRLVPRDLDDIHFAPLPPYRAIALVTALLALSSVSLHLWFRRRRAERRARDMAKLSESLKQSEEALRVSGNRLRAIIETEPEGVSVIAPDCTLLEMNPAGLAMIEAETPAAVIGKPAYPFICSEFRSAFEAFTQDVCKGNKGTLEFEIVGLKGTRRWMDMHAAPLPNENGTLHLLGVMRDITDRKRAEEKYRNIFEYALEGIFQTTPDGHYLSVNPALARMYGYETPQELMVGVSDIGRQVYVDPGRRMEFKRLIEERGFVEQFEYQAYRKDGGKIWLSENARAVRDASGATLFYEGTVADVTEQRALEEQLRQALKMEAVGRLAGGIAHDFNNLLMVIQGHAELMQARVEPSDAHHHNVEQIKKAAERANSLTQQLLAYSRRQVIEPKVLDLNALVDEMTGMLPRLLGEDIEMVVVPGKGLGRVKVDRGQIGQVLLNLSVNARDAMPRGGKLTIETANVHLDETYAGQHAGAVSPGPYVMLAVSDTGCGMDRQIQSHIFEPFFTTKEQGKGTGLGLATVYGIVKQSKGYIWVYSEPGQGACFKIYLPRVEEALEEAAGDERRLEALLGRETVLLVEDEDAVRELVRESLERHGYTVLEANCSKKAIQLSEKHKGPIHLMVTDVVMPGMGGLDLARRMAVRHPKMKVLYMSGYAENAIVHNGVLDYGATFLQKPFRSADLAHKVSELLRTNGQPSTGTNSN